MNAKSNVTVRQSSTQEMTVEQIADFVRRKTRSQAIHDAVGALLTYIRMLEHEVALGDHHAAVTAFETQNGGK
jgi:hypothetical protein